jgi:hypothetical protein
MVSLRHQTHCTLLKWFTHGGSTRQMCLHTLLITPPRASAPDRCMPSDLLSFARCCVSLLALA